jgi:hypothetical protein
MGSTAPPAAPRWLTLEFAVYYLVRPAAGAARQSATAHRSALTASRGRVLRADNRARLRLPAAVRPRADAAAVAAGRHLPAAGRAAGPAAWHARGPVRRAVAQLPGAAAAAGARGARLCGVGAPGAGRGAARTHCTRRRARRDADCARAAAPQVHAVRPGAVVGFHTVFGLTFVGAQPRPLRVQARKTDLRRSAAHLYGGKTVLLLALCAASYALSKLVAGRRAGCAPRRLLAASPADSCAGVCAVPVTPAGPS